MRLNELRDTSYEIAKSKGWHDDDMKRSFADLMALVISEMAEALEEHRKGVPPGLIYFSAVAPWPGVGVVGSRENLLDLAADGKKPEGLIIELADALIRIGDAAGTREIDLGPDLLADLVREVEPGDFGTEMIRVVRALCFAADPRYPAVVLGSTSEEQQLSYWLRRSLMELCCMAASLGITGKELERAIEIKHAYNRTRSHRHGGKLL